MKYILFLMFLTSSPGPPDKKIWSLSNIESVAFDVKSACDAAGSTIQTSVNATATLRVVGWCFASSAQPAGAVAISSQLKGLSIQSILGAQIPQSVPSEK